MACTMGQNKGKEGERQVIRLLQPVVNEVYSVFDIDAPILQRNLMQSHLGGFDIHGLEWLALEVKWQKANAVNAWWAQTLRQAGPYREPVLFYRGNRQDWKVRMFGMLPTLRDESGINWTVPVTIDEEAFLKWFRARLVQELQKL